MSKQMFAYKYDETSLNVSVLVVKQLWSVKHNQSSQSIKVTGFESESWRLRFIMTSPWPV